MFAFIFELCIFISLAGILAITLRTLPRIPKETFENESPLFRTNEVILFLERVDHVLKGIFEKFLRKTKIALMKIDHLVTKKIAKFNEDRSKGKTLFPIEEKSTPLIEKKTEIANYEFVTSVPVSGNIEKKETLSSKKRGRPKKKVDL